MYIQSIGCIYKRIGVYSSFHKAFLLCMWYGIYMGYMDIRDDCFWEYPKVDLWEYPKVCVNLQTDVR